MDAERWKQISDLAAAAADLPPDAREALLQQHPEDRAEIESLLRYLEDDSGPLDQPPSPPDSNPYEGQRIGPYRVTGELGAGGMGIVLLAQRDEPGFDRTVALKLARVSFRSDFFARRFLEERQILARLEHPNIARLLDGGVTADGTPYLAMQYIDGVPLDAWAAAENPTLHARLEILRKICAAVEYAHENLIVHRDLKPANILVTAAGEPMLLDFGTARLLDSATQTGATATALPMMTARYASPEQMRGLAGSTRSDIYSLGVILYELLTGHWPYRAGSDSAPDLMRAACEQEPIPPSRQSSTLRRELEGDLDAILLKALDKDPARRYATAGQLAEDLRRHIHNEPVSARGPSWSYLAGRFLRRHKWAVAGAAAVILSLSTATAYSLRQAAIAEREREKAVQIAAFFERLLGASRKGGVSALATGGRDMKVVDLIEATAANLNEEFRNSPDIEAGLRSSIGSALTVLGTPQQARPHVERAVELTTKLYGENHSSTMRAIAARGQLRLTLGDYPGAQSDLQRSLAWRLSQNDPDASFQHSLLAEAHLRQGDVQGARRHFTAALDLMRRHFGDRHVTTATMINNLGVVSDDAGDAAAAERHFTESAAILRQLPGPPPHLLFPLMGLLRAHFWRGEFDKALAIAEEAHRHARKTAGERHPNTAAAAMQVALIKAHLGHPDAESLARETSALQRTILPPTHIEVARGLTNLSRVLLLKNKAAEAVPLLREAYTIARKIYAKPNWRTAESRLFLGAALAQQGHPTQAEAELRPALEEMRAVLPQLHPRTVEAQRIAGRCLAPNPARCTL